VGFYETYALPIYLAGIGLLLLTLFVAKEINGSRSWLIIGPVHLQPAEFMKFTIALALARVFNMYEFHLMERKNLLLVSCIILLPVILVIAQSETGTALVYLSFLLVLYREGLPGGVLFMAIAAVVYFVLGVKFSDVQIGFFSKGELITIILIIIFAAVMVWNYMKRQQVVLNIFLLTAVTFLVAYVISLFSVQIDWGITALIAFSGVVLYLLLLFFRYRKRPICISSCL